MRRLARTLLSPGLAALALAVATAGSGAAEPAVVVSIQPVHSLVAGVMAGIGIPKLIVKGGASPHSYSLRPSEAGSLSRARLVFWIGGVLETFLEKPLKALSADALIVELGEAQGITRLPGEDAAGEGRGGEPGPEEDQRAHRPGGTDPHIWLDPDNARAIVQAAVAALTRVDPANGTGYAANGERLAARIVALDAELRRTLAPVREVPYVVLHDAYGYFERRYGLFQVAALAPDPGRKPGARRLSEVRRKIEALGVRCVFTEPQFKPALVKIVIEGTGASTGVLDPLGATLAPGPEAYFALMADLAASFRDCLGG
jgi:zinc transport system substrate-binding protein